MQGAHIVTVMELCCSDLHTILQQNDCPLLPSIIKRLVSELLKGVHAMHLHGAHTRSSAELKAADRLAVDETPDQVCWSPPGNARGVVVCLPAGPP